jgi:hypothetical protein
MKQLAAQSQPLISIKRKDFSLRVTGKADTKLNQKPYFLRFAARVAEDRQPGYGSSR